jgi:hypothetical protein
VCRLEHLSWTELLLTRIDDKAESRTTPEQLIYMKQLLMRTQVQAAATSGHRSSISKQLQVASFYALFREH